MAFCFLLDILLVYGLEPSLAAHQPKRSPLFGANGGCIVTWGDHLCWSGHYNEISWPG